MFETRLQVMGHGIIYKIDDETGYLLQEPLPASQRPEEDPSTRQGDPFKQEPREERGSNSQLIKTSWKGTKREQHLNCLIEKGRKIFFSLFLFLIIEHFILVN